MHYLKTLFFNFFIVFFANHILPDIDVLNQTKLPHIGGDLMFAVALGFVNSLIYPILKLCKQVSFLKILGFCVVVNFIAYAILKLLPLGIHVITFTGYASAAALVTLGSFLTNYLEMRHHKNCCHQPPMEPPSTEFMQPK